MKDCEALLVRRLASAFAIFNLVNPFEVHA